MYELKIRDNFSAAHNLKNYKGKCENLHGHNYIVIASFIAKKTGKNGLVVDFMLLKKALKNVLDKIDHKYLNRDVDYFKKNNPTAENIAKFIFKTLKRKITVPKLKSICVYETENSMVIYSE